MRIKRLIGLILVLVGVIFSIYSLYDMILASRYINAENVIILTLGCVLMLSGALFKYVNDLEKIERRLGKIEEGGGGMQKASHWRLRDLDYRLKKLEEKKY